MHGVGLLELMIVYSTMNALRFFRVMSALWQLPNHARQFR